jgi:hypothetical protein
MSRPFAQVLHDIRGGKLDLHAGELLNELVLAVAETRKTGTLTLKLTIKPDPEADGNQITIEPKLEVKTPRQELSGSVFFMDADGNLTRTDPKQTEMTLSRVADTGRARPGVTGSVLRDATAGVEVALPA